MLRLKLKRPALTDYIANIRICIDSGGECRESHDLRRLSIVNLTENQDTEYIRV